MRRFRSAFGRDYVPPLAPELLGLAQHVAAYERLTAETAITRDSATARKALLTHPLIGQSVVAAELVELLSAAESVSSPAGART